MKINFESYLIHCSYTQIILYYVYIFAFIHLSFCRNNSLFSYKSDILLFY